MFELHANFVESNDNIEFIINFDLTQSNKSVTKQQ